MNKELVRQNQELLNRLQAPDLKTFAALQTSSITVGTETEYIPRDDESELARLSNRDIRILDDEDVRGYSLSDFVKTDSDDLSRG